MDNDLPDGGTPPESEEDASPSSSTTAEPPGSESPAQDPTTTTVTDIGGTDLIGVGGGAKSTTQETAPAGLAFPAASVWVTEKV